MEDRAVVCITCNGSGWKPVDGALQARPCECQGELRRRNRTAAAAIPKRYYHCRLSNFRDRGNVSISSAKRRIAEYIAGWPQQEMGLLLIGGCGAGKTHLAVSALHEIIDLDKPGKLLFCNFQDLIQELHASFSSDETPSKSELVRPILEADLLVLDELGSQKPTAFVQDMLYYIVNSRYNDVKPTIFTTNYPDDSRRESDERLEQRIGERLRSRLHEMTERVIIDADDYRKSVGRI
ncbi:MAG TPA: ATP-binding protein [Thermoanaerobaculia bacterium]|nr:ATP-binding protein [Thermoanaerobaculia bacterium]